MKMKSYGSKGMVKGIMDPINIKEWENYLTNRGDEKYKKYNRQTILIKIPVEES